MGPTRPNESPSSQPAQQAQPGSSQPAGSQPAASQQPASSQPAANQPARRPASQLVQPASAASQPASAASQPASQQAGRQAGTQAASQPAAAASQPAASQPARCETIHKKPTQETQTLYLYRGFLYYYHFPITCFLENPRTDICLLT